MVAKNKNAIKISDYIKLRRTQLDMSLEDVAKIVGVGRSTVFKWEHGFGHNVTRDNIAKLAEALRIDPLILLEDYVIDPKLKTEVQNNIDTLTDSERLEVLDYIRYIKHRSKK
jgi:transcriptional regulator with XRE-family HTH domain